MKTHYGIYGGQYVAETLMAPLKELEAAYEAAKKDPAFAQEFNDILRDYVGRESPITYAKRLSEYLGGARILLKREDLQCVHSYKLRGAYNKMSSLPRAALEKGVLAASAGNHAQGVALAAKKLGAKATSGLPVRYFVREGPAVIGDDGVLRLCDWPSGAKSCDITICAYQWGADGGKVKTAEPDWVQLTVSR